jgi:type III pantothenate kinase
MIPSLVADIGNTRIKLGLCSANTVVDTAAVPADNQETWREVLHRWRIQAPASCILTGVHPARRDRLAEWLREQGLHVKLLKYARDLPIRVCLAEPDKVGIDRLLDAVAARSRTNHRPAIVIDAGSAVTVDLVDEAGVFRGGAIFPGMRMMALGLHQYTALLPEIETPAAPPDVPGGSTSAAMAAGIFWSVAGGIEKLVEQMSNTLPSRPKLFLTGGDAALLHPVLRPEMELWPAMTLEGIRLAAAGLSVP